MKTNTHEVDHADEASGDAIETPTQVVITKVASVLDLIFRIIGAIGTLASAIAMGTTDESLPFITQFGVNLFTVKYDDLPTFTFFVVANSIVGGYLVLSIPFSIFHVIKSEAKISRIILLIFDMVMLALLTAGASAATAIVYLAHKGNTNVTNWSAICQQFESFCDRISGSLIGSFGTVVMLMLLIITSTIAISRP